jgi:predicted ATPase
MGKFAEAVRVGALGLALFGVELPSAPEAQGAAIGAELAAVAANLGGRRIEDLIDAPALEDPEKVALVSLLHALTGPLFMVNPTLWTIAALKGVNVSLEHGHSSASPYSYSVYGFMLGVVMGRPVESFAFRRARPRPQ